ncbi:unnamed protein product [Ilex paraguariensis]|uniref:Uncharacterized protein n=1 Tax=Ilex paraguariensis TaxID=185542 RepID=A0ABC8UL79_9AQUA
MVSFEFRIINVCKRESSPLENMSRDKCILNFPDEEYILHKKYDENYGIRKSSYFQSSSIGIPRSLATSLNCLIFITATTVALALLRALLLPSCFPKAFSTPAISKTILTAPPAITPVPEEAGLSITFAAP